MRAVFLMFGLWFAFGPLPALAAQDCGQEESLRALLPKADSDCRHLMNLVKEFEANFPAITKHCNLMRTVSGRGRAISKADRNRLVRRVKELFNVPSWGSVVISSMPKACLERRELVYRYQREAIESFQGLIRNLDHLANDRDPLR
jgi:hypothetical protein